MMAWPLLILSYAFKQHELYGISDSMIVSVTLQLIYVAIFFYYESGYFKTMDIQEDRAGFYIVWGVMVWIPGVYALTAHYLVHHPIHLGFIPSAILIIVGSIGFYSKTSMNRQRSNVRRHDGDYNILVTKPKSSAQNIKMTITKSGKAFYWLTVGGAWVGIFIMQEKFWELYAGRCPHYFSVLCLIST
jgi:7-dehydrocholesterol reductase